MGLDFIYNIRNVGFAEQENAPINPSQESSLVENNESKFNFNLAIIPIIVIPLLVKNPYLVFGGILTILKLESDGIL